MSAMSNEQFALIATRVARCASSGMTAKTRYDTRRHCRNFERYKTSARLPLCWIGKKSRRISLTIFRFLQQQQPTLYKPKDVDRELAAAFILRR